MASAALDLLIQLKDEASAGLSAITGSLGGVGKAALTVAGGGLLAIGGGLTAAIGAGLGFNNSMEQVSAQLMAFTKDGAQTAAILDMIKERAASTPFAFEDMATAATALLPASKMAGVGLEELVAQAEILAASNPAEGLEGAAFALKEAVGGDFQSAIERFNLPRQYINQLKEEGVPNLEILSMAMGQLGLDADLVSGLANTASGRWSTFLDTLTNVAAEVSKPIFEAFSSGLAGVQTVLDANMPAITAFAGVLAGQLASAIQWLIGTGVPALIAGWASLQPALIAVGDALTVAGAMFAQLWTAVQPLIPSLQGALVPALVGLAAVVGGGIVVALGSMVAAMVAAAAPIVALVAAAGALYAAWSSNFLGIRDVVTGALSAVLGVVMAVAGQIVAFWQANGTQILAAVTQVWGQLQTIIGGALQIVVTVVQTVLGGIVSFIQTHGAAIQAALSAAWGALAAIVTNALNIIQNVIRTVLAVVRGDWAGAWEGLKATVAAVWTGIGAVIKAGIALIGAALKLIGAVIAEVGKTVLSTALEVGRSIIDGIISGVKSAGSALFGALKDMASGALSAAKSALGIGSPSKEFANNVGKWIPAGIGDGILKGMPSLNQGVDKNIGGLVDQAKKAISAQTMASQVGKPAIEGVAKGLLQGVATAKSAVQSAMQGLVGSAKSALGIASPSKVMAQEIGAPIVDGIVAGLVQRSPKAVQAMLDLASSMFDVVSKGVEAFGKLTQLGTIPQSAILNFSDAIQRTLTEFAERMRAWDKAAMSAASQFTYKAGQVVEFLTKGVELLTGIANLAMPSQGAISAFADAMAWVMREIARVSTFDLRLGLTAAVEFASGAKAVLETISIGVTALNSLADFVRPAPGVITQFTNVIYWLVSRFVLVGQAFAGQALGAAAAFAQAAGQVFAVVASGVEALLKLAEFVKPAPGVITTFSNVLYWLVSRFVAVAQAISGPALTAAATFADGAGKVIGIIGAGVDGLLKLGEFVRPAPGVIQTFANVVYWLVSRFVEVAAAIGQRGVAAAAAFADGAGKVLAVLKSGVEGLNALNTLATPTYEAMAAFSMAVDQIVWLMYTVADDVGQKATDAAAEFAEGAGKVLGILKSGVEGLNAINGLVQPSYDALAAFSMAVDQIVWLMSMAAEDVSQKATDAAAKFAEGAGKVLGILKSGVEGLNALGTLVVPTYAAMGQFSLAVDQIVWFMAMAAEDVSLKATEAAAKFAEGAGKVLGMVGAGVDALGKLVEFVAPAESNVSAFFRSLADLLEKMGTWAADFDAKAFEVTGAFAAGVQKSVAGIGAAADALGKLVTFVAPAQKNVSAFFLALADLLEKMGTWAGDFDTRLLETTAAFANGVNQSVAPLKGAIESLGKFTDFVPPAQKGVSAFFQSVGVLLTQMGVLAGQYSAEFFAGTILFGQNIAKSVESIKAAFAQMAGLADLKGIASGVLTSFTNSLTALLDELERQVAPAAENIGAALVFGIADGIQAQIPYLVATLQNAAATMVDTVQGALGIASPSKVFEQIGQYAGQGMVGGMAAMQPALAGAGAGLGMAAVGGAGAAVSSRAGGGGGDVIVNIGTGAFTLNGVQGGIGEKELRRLAQLIKEEIANERGTRG